MPHSVLDAPTEADASPSDTPQPSTTVVTTGHGTGNCPPLRGAVARTPPLLSVVAAVGGSSILTLSALTNATTTTAAAASANEIAVASPAKRPHTAVALGVVDEGGTPSPKRPNFTKPPSDESSLLSGDDEDRWGNEEAKVMALVGKKKHGRG